MTSLFQLWRITCYEWFTAIRSRRAIVVLLLFMAASVCTMNFSINALQKMEKELVKLLQLPDTEEVGVVSKTLWKSKPFQRLMKHIVKDNAVYEDITGKHPVELMYALLVFFYTPLLVVLVSSNRISDDIGSGSIRYIACRSSRFTWSFGKFLGQAGMIGVALLFSGIGAWLIAVFRLHGAGFSLMANIFDWSFRSWIYALPFLGLCMGLSHMTRSGSKATIFGILAISLFFVLTILYKAFEYADGWKAVFSYMATFIPESHGGLLWRSSPAAVATGATWMITLALCYLFLGYMAFRKRDI
ncbi:MAG: ABC transporter permease [Kiritimatiellae bacterium]|jgi:ABC-type transport system involved in multi-copper enzyme maturation permease subunit|nr:ABC transporter permease [Kiritimatiellia bacterium]